MNKDSLVNKAYVKSPFNKNVSKSIFNRIFELIKGSIKDNRLFEIDNFGEFKVERREMKVIEDSEKGAEILLPPKDKVLFKPADSIIKSVNIGND
jgi:nucleoid DNA-binding protein